MKTFMQFVDQIEEGVWTPDMNLSPEHQAELDTIRKDKRAKHAKLYKAAKKKGRDYPIAPYEDSWAYEQEFRRNKRG